MGVEHDDPLAQIHIALMAIDIKGAGGEQLQGQGHILGHLLRLLQQLLPESRQGRCLTRSFALLIYGSQTTVDDRLIVATQLLIVHAVDQGHDELRFGRNGVAVTIAVHHIQRIQMILAAGTELDDFGIVAADGLDHRPILALRVENQNLIFRTHRSHGDVALCHAGFTGTRFTDKDCTGIDLVFFVTYQRRTGNSVHTEVDALLLQNLRHLEGMQHHQRGTLHGTEAVGFPTAHRQNSVHALELLVFFHCHLAALTERKCLDALGFPIQLLQRFRSNQQKQLHLIFPLVIILQGLQVFERLLLLLLHMIRSHAGEISVCSLPLIVAVVVGKHRHVAQLCLLNGLHTVTGQEIDGVHDVGISRDQTIHEIVIQIVGDVLQEQNPNEPISHLQVVIILPNPVRRNVIAEILPALLSLADMEIEMIALAGTVEVVQEHQPLLCAHGGTSRADLFERLRQIQIQPLKILLRIRQFCLGDANRHVLVLNIADPLAGFTVDELIELHTQLVILVPSKLHPRGGQGVPFGGTMPKHTDLAKGIAVDAFDDIGCVGVQELLLVIIRGNLEVDIRKTIAFGVKAAAAEYAVLPDLLDGNEALDTAADAEAALTLLLMPSDSLGHGFSPFSSFCGAALRHLLFEMGSTWVPAGRCTPNSWRIAPPSFPGI